MPRSGELIKSCESSRLLHTLEMLLEDQVISLSWGNLVSKRKIKQGPLEQGAVQEQNLFRELQNHASRALKQNGLSMFPSTETQTPPVHLHWLLKLV